MANNVAAFVQNGEIDIFQNLLDDIRGLQKFGEATVKLEEFLELLRPRGNETQQLYDDLRRAANQFRRTEDRLIIYIKDVADFVDETLEGIEGLSEESCEEFIEDTLEGVEGLCRRFDDSLETYHKVQDQLRKVKDKAKHGEKDMMVWGISSTLTELGPHGATVANVLKAVFPNMKFVSGCAPYVGPAIAGVAAGVLAANTSPVDNKIVKNAGGAAVGSVTCFLCIYLASLACPPLNAALTTASAVSAFVSFDHRNELIATVQCIGQVDECITNHRKTILALKRLIDNAVTRRERADQRLRNRREGDEHDLARTRRLLLPLEKALRKLKEQVLNN